MFDEFPDRDSAETMHHCSVPNSRWQSFLLRNLLAALFKPKKSLCTTAPAGFPRLQELCEIVSTPIGGLDDLETSLTAYRASLTPSLVTQVIESCKDEAPSRRLLRFFVWSNNNLKRDLSDRDYNHAIRAFASKKDHTALEILLSDLKRDGRTMEAVTYSTIAEALVKLRKANEAVSLFKNLEKYNCPQDGSTVAAIVGELCAHGHAERAQEVANKHKEKIRSSGAGQLWISKRLLYAWAEREDAKEARRVIQEMKSSGLSPDLFCYNAFLRCLCERNLERNPSGLVPEALNVMMEMRAQNVVPDSISYNVLLSCLGRARRAKESCQILERMKETGCGPDWTSYYLVVRVLYRGERFGKGNSYLDEMRERGLAPNRKFYYGLIGVLCKVHRPNYALDLLGRMKESELGGYGPVYNVLILKLCSVGDFEKAKELWDEAANTGVEIRCSSNVFDPKVVYGDPRDVPFIYSKDCAKSKKKKTPKIKKNIQEELFKKKLEKKIAARNKNQRKPFEKEIAAIRKKNQQKHFKKTK